MNKIRGLVKKIIPFSAVDGPGNRLVIFLQGCNFRCINCHNPQTIGLCTGCGKCVTICPTGALYLEPLDFEVGGYSNTSRQILGAENLPAQVHFKAAVCKHCEQCLAICPVSSNPHAQWMEVGELRELVTKARPFLSGITVSGGEATQQLAFLLELFRTVKSDPALTGLSTFVDSNGSLPLAGWEEILPVLDGAMIDLKALDSDIHRKLTGMDNAQVLASIAYLYRQARLYEVRLLIIPGYNAEIDQAQATARFLSEVCRGTRLKLIPFRQHGVSPAYRHLEPPTTEQMLTLKAIYQEQGFQQVSIT